MTDLESNNYVAKPLVLVRNGNETSWYIADVSYWIVEYWDTYCEAHGVDVEKKYYNYIQQFRIDPELLKEQVSQLHAKGKIDVIKDHLPSVYFDLNERKIISMYYEQALENRIPEGWTGRFDNFLDMISPADRFWIIDGVDISID